VSETDRTGPLVLIVEDEPQVRRFLRTSLGAQGFRLLEAASAREAVAAATSHNPELILLDLGLPDGDGIDLTRSLREWSRVPIVVISARGREADKVAALDAGADDYLTKPFSVLELQARVKALLRRSAVTASRTAQAAAQKPTRIEQGRLRIDRVQRRAWIAGTELVLTPREFDLLWHFVQHPGRVFTRTELLADVWGHGYEGYDHTVNSHINRLRSKLDDERAEAAFIHTVWGVGYRFEVAA